MIGEWTGQWLYEGSGFSPKLTFVCLLQIDQVGQLEDEYLVDDQEEYCRGAEFDLTRTREDM